MVKRLERQKIQAAFKNMRDAGIKSFAFFIFGYPGETLADDGADDATTRSSSIRTSPTSIRRCRIPGTALYEKCVREGLLKPEDADWTKMEYSYYLLRGNGLDERVVMDAINRAKRRFFLRPGVPRAPPRRRRAAGADQAGDRLAGAVAHAVRRPRSSTPRSRAGRQFPPTA